MVVVKYLGGRCTFPLTLPPYILFLNLKFRIFPSIVLHIWHGNYLQIWGTIGFLLHCSPYKYITSPCDNSSIVFCSCDTFQCSGMFLCFLFIVLPLKVSSSACDCPLQIPMRTSQEHISHCPCMFKLSHVIIFEQFFPHSFIFVFPPLFSLLMHFSYNY